MSSLRTALMTLQPELALTRPIATFWSAVVLGILLGTAGLAIGFWFAVGSWVSLTTVQTASALLTALIGARVVWLLRAERRSVDLAPGAAWWWWLSATGVTLLLLLATTTFPAAWLLAARTLTPQDGVVSPETWCSLHATFCPDGAADALGLPCDRGEWYTAQLGEIPEACSANSGRTVTADALVQEVRRSGLHCGAGPGQLLDGCVRKAMFRTSVHSPSFGHVWSPWTAWQSAVRAVLVVGFIAAAFLAAAAWSPRAESDVVRYEASFGQWPFLLGALVLMWTRPDLLASVGLPAEAVMGVVVVGICALIAYDVTLPHRARLVGDMAAGAVLISVLLVQLLWPWTTPDAEAWPLLLAWAGLALGMRVVLASTMKWTLGGA